MHRPRLMPCTAAVLAALLAGAASDSLARETVLVSRPEQPLLLGTQADRTIGSGCALNTSGRFVVFSSAATQLVADDRNGIADVFVKDRTTGAVTRVSRRSDGSESRQRSQGGTISGSGRFVAFSSLDDLTGSGTTVEQVYLADRQTGTLVLVSHTPTGAPGNAQSNSPTLDSTGAVLVFTSSADNLVSGDTNVASDVFGYTLATGVVQRISTDGTGIQGNANSSGGRPSNGGASVAFSSSASNLVAGDGNALYDIFVKDLATGAIERVSVDTAGGDADALSGLAGISADGRRVAFASSASDIVAGDTNGVGDIFIRDRNTGTTTRVSVDAAGVAGDTGSRSITYGGDGSRLLFVSASTTWGGNASGVDQLYLKELSGSLTRLTDTDDPVFNGFALTPAGDLACFNGGGEALAAGDTNQVGDLHLIVPATGAIERANVAESPHPVLAGNESSLEPDISDDGTRVVLTSGANVLDAEGLTTAGTVFNVLLFEPATATYRRLSNTSSGEAPNESSGFPRISGDGRFVALETSASDLGGISDHNDDVDVYRIDIDSGAVTRVSSEASSGSAGEGRSPSISDNGARVAFYSSGDQIVEDDINEETDVFVWDVVTGTVMASVSTNGDLGDNFSRDPALSGDGLVVAFTSSARNLVDDDTTFFSDVFVRDLVAETTTRISLASTGAEANGDSHSPAISRDGRYVAFVTEATNLLPGDVDPGNEIYIYDRSTQSLQRATSGLAVIGLQLPTRPWLSPDGNLVLFDAIDAIGVHSLLRYDRAAQARMILQAGDPLGETEDRPPLAHAASADGRITVYDWIDRLVPADTNDPREDSDVYALLLSPGSLAPTVSAATVTEGGGPLVIRVARNGGTDAAVRVQFVTASGSAQPASDFQFTSGALQWDDGESGEKLITVNIANDALPEGDEQFEVRLLGATGGAGIGEDTVIVTIEDDDDATDALFANGFEN